MSMETNLQGRLRNTTLPLTHGLLPLFEAVVNSIHAIEEAGLSLNQGKIKIEILRTTQLSMPSQKGSKKPGPEACGDILGFKITDNGIGFTDDNLKSFQTLDGDHKADKGCRGVGRLLWLKAFRRVNVNSVYEDAGGNHKSRRFRFDKSNGVGQPEDNLVAANMERSTCIHLDGYEKRYRDASRKTTSVIANTLFEHCLWYFVREGGAPKISISDDSENIKLDRVFEDHMHSSASKSAISIKDKKFELTHVKLRSTSSQSHAIAFCASNRLVKEESLSGKVAGLYGKLQDANGEFVYACYVSSDYLDEKVRSERIGFDIEESIDGLFAESEISFSQIRDAVVNNVSGYLSEHLEENKKAGRERVETFVSNEAPRYRPILSYIPEDQLNIDPSITDKELDVVLHRHLAEIEQKLLVEGHDLMTPRQGENHPDYQQRVQAYLKTAEDIKKSDLANYVSHRKVILDLLEKAIERKQDGKYVKEELIHELIMPIRVNSDEVMSNSCNLWLIDERLAFHDYLASDKTLTSMPITGSTETKEPDICALNVFDNPLLVSDGNTPSLASIVVVEIKKPMRNDAKEGEEKDPIEQALGYLDRIRQGDIKTRNGRPIPKSESIPGFCYVLCDITPSIEKRCKIHDAIQTSDGFGYFFYHKAYRAYVEVISFDGLVKAAKERNRAFFDKLGLPT